MKNLKKLFTCLLVCLGTLQAMAQNSGEYEFLTDTTARLDRDANGNVIDFSSTVPVFAEGTINQNTVIADLPFQVVMLGKIYKQYLIGSAGYVALGNTDIPSEPFQFPTTANNTLKLGASNPRFQGVLAPFWDQQQNRSAKYLTVGTAPNRCFVVDWVTSVPQGATYVPGYECHFQARVYETTGAIEYVYGKMKVPPGNTTAVNFTIAMGRNSALADSQFIIVKKVDSLTYTRVLSEYTAMLDYQYNKPDSGALTPLHTENDTICRRIVFIPNAIPAASNFDAYNVDFNSGLLYWVDNSTTEVTYEVFQEDRYGNYKLFTITQPNVNFYTLTGLYPGETYRFKVRAMGQGRYSDFSNVLEFRTPSAPLVKAQQSGDWNDSATWGGTIPGPNDSVSISGGLTVTLDTVDAKCYTLTVDTGTLVYQDTNIARKLRVYSDVKITSSGTITVPVMPVRNNILNELYLRGDLVNDGKLNLFEKDTTTLVSGVKLGFFDANISSIKGSGSQYDLYQLAIERTAVTDTVYIIPDTLTAWGYAQDSAGFLIPTTLKGTAVFGGDFTMNNRLFTVSSFTAPAGCGIWFNNPNLTVTAPNVPYTTIYWNGDFRLSQGTVNIGTQPGDVFLGTFNALIEGGAWNHAGYLYSNNTPSFVQTGGKISVAIAGNNTTTASFNLINSAGIVKLLGGEIVIVNRGSSASTARRDYYVLSNLATSAFTNTRIILGENLDTAASTEFVISGYMPLVYTDSTATDTFPVRVRLASETRIFNNLYISPNDTLNLNGQALWIYDTLVNNGYINSTAGNSGSLIIAGKGQQRLEGTGVAQPYRFEMFQADTASSFTLTRDTLLQTISANFTQGKLVNSNYLVIGDSVRDITVEVGRTGTRYNGAVLDSFPALRQGTGRYLLSYINLGKTYPTSFEVPRERQVQQLSINSDSAIAITRGKLNIDQILTLTKGKFITDTTNLIRVANGESNGIAGGSATAFVDGPLTRRIKAGLAGTSYTFPVGDSIYNVLALDAIITDTAAIEITVGYNKPVLNYTAGNSISRIDSAFGHWYIRGDSAVKSLKSFGFTFNYPAADAFTRIAGGNAARLDSIPTLDSIGVRTSVNVTTLTASTLTLDSAKPVMFIAPATFEGDTLYAATYKVGPGRTFNNLTEVARKLNSSYIGGDLVFEMAADYDDESEVFPVYFDRLRYSDANHNILIKLDTGAAGLVTGNGVQALNASLGMISLSGVDSITFDGMGYDLLGHATGVREWTFKTETNTANASVFMLRNDSRYITLRNLNILANAELTNQGAILIGPAMIGGRGNDYATIQNNFLNISDRLAIYGILNVGATTPNDSIQIIENEICNFRQGYVFGSTMTGAGWLISRNHFYQNDARTTAYPIRALDLQADATIAGLEVSYNYFGGSTRNAGGAVWNYTGTTAVIMSALAAQSTSVSVFKNNIFRNYNQTTTAAIATQLSYFLRGNWQVTGNKYGGNSWTDNAITTNASGAFSCIYFASSATNTAEITDNEISFVKHNPGAANANKTLHGIDILAPNYCYIARNSIHDLLSTSTRLTSIPDGGLTGIFINNGYNGHLIEYNELYNLTSQPVNNNYAYQCAIGVNNGGGTVRYNKIHHLYYNSPSANLAHLVGIHTQGNSWFIYNNQISIANELYPNLTVSMQGIRVYSNTLPATRIAHNSIILSGVTRNAAGYGIVHASSNIPLDIYNNIVVNQTITTTPANANARQVALHGGSGGVYLNCDNNLLYTTNPATTVYNVSTNQTIALSSWQTYGYDKASLSFLPKFQDTLANLLLTTDTINWGLKAAGKKYDAYVTNDYESDIRNTNQPDIGADEFTAPMYLSPVLLSGNDTLCQGNLRSIIVQNPNSDGKVSWFGSLNGLDTLYTGDTLHTGNIDRDSIVYAQVSDSLMKSYRIAIPLKVKPVITPVLADLPVDSVCYGTSVMLTADSTIGSVISWFTDTLAAAINTGNTFQTPSLTADTTYYLQTTYNGCNSAYVPFKISVSALVANTPTVNSQQVCEGNPVSWTTSPDVLRWYTGTRTNLAPLAEDTIFTTGNLAEDTTFYYEVFNGNCASERKAVSVQVNFIPSAPVIDTLFTTCYNTGLSLTANALGTVKWFDSDTATTPIATGTLHTGNLLQDTVYYLQNERNGCNSERIKVAVMVKQAQTPQLASVVSPICFNNTSTAIVTRLSDGTVRWFDDMASLTPIATGDTLNTPALSADRTYYFELFDGLCTSGRDSVTITVNAFAAQPVVTAVDSICYGTTDTLFASAAGATIEWYDNRNGAVLATGESFITNTVNGNTRYFVKAVYGACQSTLVEIQVPVRALPQPPVTDSIAPVCRGNSTTLNAAANGDIYWYTSVFATIPSDTGTIFETGPVNLNTTYYVQTFDGKCYSNKRPVAVQTRNSPALPQVPALEPMCWNDLVTVKATSPVLIRWYVSDTAETHFHSDSSLYLGRIFRDTTFYVESFDGVCHSARVPFFVPVLNYLEGFSATIPDSIAINTATGLVAQGPADNIYNWNFGAGANISSASGPGPFQVSWATVGMKNVRLIITKKSGNVTCDTIFTKLVKVYDPNAPTSVDKYAAETGVQVYPNPASSSLNIQLHNNQQVRQIQLVNMLGQVVKAIQPADAAQVYTLEVADINRGVYQLMVTLDNGRTAIQKIVIE